MKPYFEPRFLGALILKTRRAASAEAEMRRFSGPHEICGLVVVEIEHLLYWGQQHEPLVRASRTGKGRWDYLFAEGIFKIESMDWDSGIRLARAAMRDAQKLGQSWSMYLHAALAASSATTHYLSFQPEFRAVAKTFGLRLLPERL